MDAVSDVLGQAAAYKDQATAAIAALPITPVVQSYYTQFLGDTSATVFWIEIFPILYVTVLPLFCAIFTICGLCRGKKKSTGQAFLRRVQHAAGAINFMKKSSGNKFKGPTSLSKMEKGSPGKGKAAVSKSLKA